MLFFVIVTYPPDLFSFQQRQYAGHSEYLFRIYAHAAHSELPPAFAHAPVSAQHHAYARTVHEGYTAHIQRQQLYAAVQLTIYLLANNGRVVVIQFSLQHNAKLPSSSVLFKLHNYLRFTAFALLMPVHSGLNCGYSLRKFRLLQIIPTNFGEYALPL